MTFNTDSFLQDLKKRMPNARVMCRDWTPEEKENIRDGLHKINQLGFKGPVLGGGALYPVRRKNEP